MKCISTGFDKFAVNLGYISAIKKVTIPQPGGTLEVTDLNGATIVCVSYGEAKDRDSDYEKLLQQWRKYAELGSKKSESAATVSVQLSRTGPGRLPSTWLLMQHDCSIHDVNSIAASLKEGWVIPTVDDWLNLPKEQRPYGCWWAANGSGYEIVLLPTAEVFPYGFHSKAGVQAIKYGALIND